MIRFEILNFRDLTGTRANIQRDIVPFLDKVSAALARLMDDKSPTLHIDLTVMDLGGAIAAAGAMYDPFYRNGSVVTLTNIVTEKVQSGVDLNGARHDLVLEINPNMLTSRSYNTVSVLTHEIFHTLGFNGFRDDQTGLIDRQIQSDFDTHVTLINGEPFYTGPAGRLVFGGNIPLAELGSEGSSIYHVAEDAPTGVIHDLMQPYAYRDSAMSNTDLAILRDLGYAIRDTLVSRDGKTFLPGSGAQTVVGSSRIDHAQFNGDRDDYTVSLSGSSVVVRSEVDSGSVATLNSIERVNFTGESLAFDISGNAGQAFRLYQAALGRAPDLAGIGYQLNALDQGLSLQDLARNFIASPEFSAKYGALTNTDFVSQLYTNILHRPGEAAGVAFYNQYLTANPGERANVLMGFSESPENQAALIGVVSQGIEFIPVLG